MKILAKEFYKHPNGEINIYSRETPLKEKFDHCKKLPDGYEVYRVFDDGRQAFLCEVANMNEVKRLRGLLLRKDNCKKF
jgi:hypothetical protein